MTARNHSKTIILCAGGTGGHVFPAAALAAELQKRGYAVRWITDIRGHEFTSAFNSVPVYVVQAGPLGKGMHKLLAGTLQSLHLMLKDRSAAVIGFGGYPSVPGVFAAQLLCIPTLVHEQNAVLGKSNIMLGRLAKRVALSFASSKEEKCNKVIVTGNPVRREITALHTLPFPAADGTFRIFIMGGSLGARVFSDVVPAALAQLPSAIKARLEIVQQCRAEDLDTVRTLYAQAGITARLENFFKDVPDILKKTHLVICRSGASTVAELTASGRPAIYVPYPHHRDAQQKANAQAVVNAGGSWMFEERDFTTEALKSLLEQLITDADYIRKAAVIAHSFGKPYAAQKLADEIMKIIS